ncbi:DUF6796 family protein [Enterococcus sp. AZ109]|uniref:DUF6796 family protein n=1 Tax=Enterococcus sp. AZ109 TaxID=2774634 RepID=UPI003F24D089
MNDAVLGICGIVGGCLCAVGDVLFDWKGPGNQKTGPGGIIDSNWLKMSGWRFKASIIVAACGVPLYGLGFLGMSHQLAESNQTLADLFLISAVIGSAGGLFIHVLVCCFPLMSQALHENKADPKILELLVARIFQAVKIPFVVMFCFLVIATSLILMVAIWSGNLSVASIFYWWNPLMLMVTGWLFRLLDKERFADLPGIIMPSVGIAMIGLMTLLSAL